MLCLHRDDIISLYCLVDEILLKPKPRPGHQIQLSNTELVTMLLWNVLVLRQKTIKYIHASLVMYHSDDFPYIPQYSGFVDACHRVTPQLVVVLESLLDTEAEVRIVDSTMIPVCKLCRSDRHKVAKSIAAYGKNHQGWHYGFKLHASINAESGRLSAVCFTGANFYDVQALPAILNKNTLLAVGDGGYTASVMRRIIWNEYGCHVIAPPHPKQTRKLMTWWQHKLLLIRPKIESVFDYLKEHLRLVTSFPRSVKGYFFHYLRVLAGCALLVG